VEREVADWFVRAPRRATRREALAHWPDGSSVPVVVANISYAGCRLTSRHSFVPGETIGLALPELGRITAHIRWVRGGTAGVRFLLGDSARDARRARIGV